MGIHPRGPVFTQKRHSQPDFLDGLQIWGHLRDNILTWSEELRIEPVLLNMLVTPILYAE